MEEKAVNNEMKAHSKSLAEETIERKVKVKNPLEMAA